MIQTEPVVKKQTTPQGEEIVQVHKSEVIEWLKTIEGLKRKIQTIIK